MGAYGEKYHDPSVMVYIELNHAPISHPDAIQCTTLSQDQRPKVGQKWVIVLASSLISWKVTRGFVV